MSGTKEMIVLGVTAMTLLASMTQTYPYDTPVYDYANDNPIDPECTPIVAPCTRLCLRQFASDKIRCLVPTPEYERD
jgi:hypothetical protein